MIGQDEKGQTNTGVEKTKKILNYDPAAKPSVEESFKVKVYVNHGVFTYAVPEASSALEHAGVIAERGVYRRSNKRGEVEFHKVVKVKVVGVGLSSQFNDAFERT